MSSWLCWMWYLICVKSQIMFTVHFLREINCLLVVDPLVKIHLLDSLNNDRVQDAIRMRQLRGCKMYGFFGVQLNPKQYNFCYVRFTSLTLFKTLKRIRWLLGYSRLVIMSVNTMHPYERTHTPYPYEHLRESEPADWVLRLTKSPRVPRCRRERRLPLKEYSAS